MKNFDRKKLVESFAGFTKELFQEILGQEVLLKKIELKVNPSNISGFGAVISFVEDIAGNIVCNFPKEAAQKITEVMNGISLDELETEEEKQELMEGSIGEIANMVGGRAMTEFDHFGVRCNITTPTIFFGTNMKLISRGQIIYAINYEYNNDNAIEIFVTLKKA